MIDQVKEDIARNMPAARELFASVMTANDAPSARVILKAAQNTVRSEDYWAGYLLPVKVIGLYLCDRYVRDNPDVPFETAMAHIIGQPTHTLVSLETATIAAISGETVFDVETLMTRHGYRIEDGLVVHHRAMELDYSAELLSARRTSTPKR